jgi:FkbM family methyltransferase
VNPLTTARFIATHPFSRHQPLKGISRYIGWQLRSKLTGKPKLFRFTPNSQMWLAPGLRGASGNYYCGLHEYADMAFVMHFLKPGELLVDVGANVGSYSLLAAAECGARVLAFEPVPATYDWLQQNIAVNQLQQNIAAFNMALGAMEGTATMTSTLDAQNHITSQPGQHTISVPVQRLDDRLQGEVPALIKIDVEGAEDQVLAGAVKTIADPRLQGLIIEMSNKPFPEGNGISCHDWLLQQGFLAFRYEPDTRSLEHLSQPHWHNTIYLRNVEIAKKRLSTALQRKWWTVKF